MPKYECTYTGNTIVDGEPKDCTFTVIRDGPCLANASPPPNMQCENPVLTGSKELEGPSTGEQVGHSIIGAAAGAGAVVAVLSNPGGWVIGAGAVVGALIGWFSS